MQRIHADRVADGRFWYNHSACGGAQRQVKKLTVNGAELAYVEDGKGDTVVFVHGANAILELIARH